MEGEIKITNEDLRYIIRKHFNISITDQVVIENLTELNVKIKEIPILKKTIKQ